MKTGANRSEEPPSPSDCAGLEERGRRRPTAPCSGPKTSSLSLKGIGPNGDQRLLTALITHISDELVAR